MAWTKHFHTAPSNKRTQGNSSSGPNVGFKNYSSTLPEYYSGHPNRIERYLQYDAMDQDSEINAALDILAEFCTQSNVDNKMSFQIHYHSVDATETEIGILQKELHHWSNLQDFRRKVFKIVRNVFKNGDQVFIRDPETQRWHFVDSANVEKIVVDEAAGKEIEQYVIRDVGVNFESMAATEKSTNASSSMPGLLNRQGGNSNAAGAFQLTQGPMVIDADHVVHISLTEEMDMTWPFGRSLLEDIFKVYKQKELLEDAIIIYRVQRAPERRVFYIDVGDMPSHLAMTFVERVKNEIHQRRIPSQTGGGSQIMDSTYNPMCLALDTTIPLLDGRTLSLNELITEYKDSKENWTYSCDPITGKIVPGKITWAGVTRKNAEVIKLHLDNGSSITVTPDHKIPVLGKGFVEAKDLTETDSLISYKTREQSLESSSNNRSYTQIYDHELNDWVYSHRMVGSFFKGTDKHQELSNLIKNSNNTSTNYNEDHIKYHIVKIELLDKRQDTGTITIDGNENYHDYHTFPINNSIFVKNSIMEDYFFPQTCLSLDTEINLLDGRILSLQEIINEYNDGKENFVYSINQTSHAIEPGKIVWADKTRLNTQVIEVKLDNDKSIICTPDHKFIMRDGSEVEAQNLNINDSLMPLYLKDDGYYIDNSDGEMKHTHLMSCPKPETVIHHIDFTSNKEYDSQYLNHKVASITLLDKTIDTGDITVESSSDSHIFALASGIFVHNSEGRGSKVETLPGGENLGQIDDLKHFSNKLFRALRIPASYLPTGPEEGGGNFSDGRLGTALIQEYRFNEYCKRLQNILSRTFDHEFKLFLKNRGVNIDNSLFELIFNEPQNFASYRQADLDASRLSGFTQIEQIPYMSKRFAMKRYLGLSDDEMLENTKLWEEENPDKSLDKKHESVGSDIRSVGITPGGINREMSGAELPDDFDIDSADFDGDDSDFDGPDLDGGSDAGPELDAGPDEEI